MTARTSTVEPKSKKSLISKLTVARTEMEDVLRESLPVARFDPVLLPQNVRMELSALIDKLDRVIRTCAEQQ